MNTAQAYNDYHRNRGPWAPSRHPRAERATKVAVLVALVAATLAVFTGTAHAAACGGQGAAPQPVPYQCTLPPKVIDGSTWSAVVNANGTSVTVLIHLAAPRTVDTPVRIVHHEGISGAGGTEDTAQGVLLAGQVNITLSDSSPCRAGQLDVKAVFIGNGDSQGRIGGPWIENGTGCTTPPATTVAPPTTVTPPATTTVTVPGAPPRTAPPRTAPPASGLTQQTAARVSAGGRRRTMPRTGPPYATQLAGTAAALLAVGLICLAAKRHRPA